MKLARKAAEEALRPKSAQGRLTSTEIKDLVRQLKGIVAILANADREDRKAVYDELNPPTTSRRGSRQWSGGLTT